MTLGLFYSVNEGLLNPVPRSRFRSVFLVYPLLVQLSPAFCRRFGAGKYHNVPVELPLSGESERR